jgi:hypothetical protein
MKRLHRKNYSNLFLVSITEDKKCFDTLTIGFNVFNFVPLYRKIKCSAFQPQHFSG